MKSIKIKLIQTLAVLLFLTAANGWAQTTEFAYQGKLNDAGSAANGTYQMEFKLFGSASGADQIGATLTKPGVSVTNGVFNVGLDFGAAAFDGTDRFLEVAVRRNAGDAFTVLSPRQKINSAPYAIKSKSSDTATNSTQLGGVAASEYVTTTSVGSTFIKNSTTRQTGNFNISGNGIIGGSLSVSGAGGGSTGVYSTGDTGVFGNSTTSSGTGVLGAGSSHGVFGTSGGGNGVSGNSSSGVGVFGKGESQGSIALRSSGSSWFQGDSTPLPAAAGKGIVVGFAGEQGYIASFDYGSFTPKNLVLNGPGGNVGIGVANPTQKLEVAGTTKTNVLQITGGSDLAENFEFSETVKPGLVVAIDPHNAGKLTLARGVYNRRVAGVISGANNLAAGMLLPNVKEVKNSMPVALSGRVWVYCDATRQPIKPGDLLTSSATPGHAMKVVNYSKAQGAIIGKAMTELKSGRGLVLVIVTLQ